MFIWYIYIRINRLIKYSVSLGIENTNININSYYYVTSNWHLFWLTLSYSTSFLFRKENKRMNDSILMIYKFSRLKQKIQWYKTYLDANNKLLILRSNFWYGLEGCTKWCWSISLTQFFQIKQKNLPILLSYASPDTKLNLNFYISNKRNYNKI